MAEVQDLALVALVPTDLAPAQSALSSWCADKKKSLEGELSDLGEHLLIAKANGWKLRGLHASIQRTEQRITYYQKVKNAVDAGYLMVPNFPVTLLAVRVREEAERPRKATEASYSGSRAFEAKPELLPPGGGRYVDDRLFHRDESYDMTNEKGEKRHVSRYVSSKYDDPDFPFAMVKPAVLQATQRAMALKIFDTVGVVQDSAGRDPIMVGQILDPRGNDRRVTFFLAWWLDTRSL